MDVTLIVIALIVGVVGLLGVIVPVLPGAPLSWIGLLVAFFSEYTKSKDKLNGTI